MEFAYVFKEKSILHGFLFKEKRKHRGNWMQYFEKIEEYHGENRTAITLGKFDAFHKGHQKLLNKVMDYANLSKNQEEKIDSIVFAFDMYKFRREHSMEFKQVMLRKEKVAYLETKVDYMIQCIFDEEIRCMEAEMFIENVIVEKFKAKYVVVGSDFRFGYKARGNVELLRHYAEVFDYQVIEIQKETYQGNEISTTLIKNEIQKGNMKDANAMLGYQHHISGIVNKGQQLGRKLGFPTMNIKADEYKLLPPNGVYVIQIDIGGEIYNGIANIGIRPTVLEESELVVESHVFDYEDDTYGMEIKVCFLHRIRTEKRFRNVEILKSQVHQDMEEARKYFLGENYS